MTTARRTGTRLWCFARRFVARLWSYWNLPPVVSRRLVAALVAWPVLLFAFFLMPEVGYLSVPPLFATATQPSGKADQPAPLQQIRQLAVLALPMEGDTSQDPDSAQSERTRQLRERVGTNILEVAGYLSEAYFIFNQEQYPALSYYVLKPDGRAVSCAMPDVPVSEESTREHAAYLALAIVAVEKFNRNAMHRLAERTYAKLYRRAFGRLPDLSFGPAQIRLSLLRQIAAERPDWPEVASWASMADEQLLDVLWQECNALRIVTTFALHQIDRRQLSDADVAATYAGQRRRSAAPIDYASIVVAMVSMMEQVLPDKGALPPAPIGGDPRP
jgi:hypothetical protein